MQLLPDLFQITPDLYFIYLNLIDDENFSDQLRPAKDLIEEAVLEYYPDLLFENEGVYKKLESASSRCRYLLSDSDEQLSEQASILYSYCRALIAAYYCYQGQWKSAKKVIKESQSIAVKLVKKEKSALHLCFQACIKAFSARILFTLAEYEQAQKMYASSIRLFRQAQKKGGSPQWLIRLGLQRTSLLAGDICNSSAEYEQAFEYYELSIASANENSSSSLYHELLAVIEDEGIKELFVQLLHEMNPRDLLPEVKEEEEETEFDFKEMEEALLASHLQALLVMERPDYYDLLSFFGALYFLLEYWYRKVPEEQRMPNEDLILLCKLFSAYQHSRLFARLFDDMFDESEQEQEKEMENKESIESKESTEGKERKEKEEQAGEEDGEDEQDEEEEEDDFYQTPPVPEEFRKDLFHLPQAFEVLAKEIEEGKEIQEPNAFKLTTDQRGEVLEKLYRYYEKKMFRSPPGVRFDESIEYQIYPIEAYLYLVSLINQSSKRGQNKAGSYKFFDLCWSLMGGYYEVEDDYKLGYFFGKRIFDCMGKDDPLEWFSTYGTLLDFYSEFYNFCFGAGEDEEGYRYRWKVDQIKEELYKSGFYNQPDWMFR